MFGRNKKRLDEENNELNRRHLRIMAIELGREFIGSELDEHFFDVANNRLRNVISQ